MKQERIYMRLYLINNIKGVKMEEKMRTLEDKLNFINDAKKSNIAKINIESINIGRVTTNPILLKKQYKFGIH